MITLMLWASLAWADDPKAAADQVRDALAAGDCAKAVSVAQKYADAAPADPIGAKLLGDGFRCQNDNFHAVAAYRKALSMGSADPALQRLIDTLGKALATVDVTVQGYDPTLGAPTVQIVRGQEVVAATSSSGGAWEFRDLPAGEALQLRISGPGIPQREESLPPLEKGTTTPHQVTVHQETPAVLTLAPWTASATVELVGKDGKTPLVPGDHVMSAGKFSLVVHSGNGDVTQAVELSPGQKVEISVDDLIPGLLSIVGAPAGSLVTFSGGPTDVPAVQLPDAGGATDPNLGVDVLPAQTVSGLRTGEYDLRVTHPFLGQVDQQVLVIGGEVSTATIPLDQFQHAANLREAYSTWKAGQKSTPMPGKVWAGAGGAVVGAGVATLGVLLEMGARGQMSDARATYEADAATDPVTARDDYLAMGAARKAEVLPWAIAGVGVVGLGFGATVSVSGLMEHHHAHAADAWDPMKAVGPWPPPASSATPTAP